ncbi:MAG TPA: riboflavin synthase [Ornithinicoccus sp.]|nr:riboflavin synthase [Ornithinicoccus sp.]
MFTGIVEELGELRSVSRQGDSAVLRIRGPLVSEDLAPGDSVAVNGVCLTVVDRADGWFTADVMGETLARTALGDLDPGSPVNLERALRSDGRFGGHVVQGHVDGTTTVLDRSPAERWEVVTLALPPELARYVVHKGSITLDGVSLTVSAVLEDAFQVSLIPTTLERTTLGRRAPGERVNVEADVLAKYVERLLVTGAVPS